MLPKRKPSHRLFWTPAAILEYIGWWVAALLFLAACTTPPNPAETPLPDEYLPTAVAMTIQAGNAATQTAATPTMEVIATAAPTESQTKTPTRQPTATATRGSTAATPRPPTHTPAPTPTPEIPIAKIQMLSPGPASLIVSPLRTIINMIPGNRGTVIIELLGEDGRTLVIKVLSYTPGTRVRIAADLDFEIPAVSEAARLVVSTEDENGRVSALASVDLVLLSIGQDEINPAGEQLETIIIREPIVNTMVQGGKVVVSGLALPASDEPLIIELLKANGAPVGPSRMVEVTPLDDGSGYGTFTAEVPYTVTEVTRVRLVIYERAGRIPGVTHLTSMEVLLAP